MMTYLNFVASFTRIPRQITIADLVQQGKRPANSVSTRHGDLVLLESLCDPDLLELPLVPLP